MQVYSTPITPPPTTINDRGSSGKSRIWSLFTIVCPLIGTFGEPAGLVPTAMMMLLRLQRRLVPADPPRSPDEDPVKTRDSVHDVNAVARKLRLGHVHLGPDHRLHPERQVGHRDLFLHPVIHPIH